MVRDVAHDRWRQGPPDAAARRPTIATLVRDVRQAVERVEGVTDVRVDVEGSVVRRRGLRRTLRADAAPRIRARCR